MAHLTSAGPPLYLRRFGLLIQHRLPYYHNKAYWRHGGIPAPLTVGVKFLLIGWWYCTIPRRADGHTSHRRHPHR